MQHLLAQRPRQMVDRRRAWAVAASVAALMPVSGRCLTWDYVPTLITGVRYETNPDYVSVSDLENDAYAGVLEAVVKMRGESDRARLELEPRVRIRRYTGGQNDDRLDTEDYYLPLSGLLVGERSQLGAAAGYSQISTRDSEIRVTDPNTPGQPGSSGRIVIVDEDQERWYLQPSVSFQVTPRDLFSVSLSAEDVSYTEAALTNRSDYLYGSASGSWTRSLGSKSRISAGVNVDGFRADQPDNPIENETVSYGFDVGYQYSYSDVTSLGITVGSSRSDITVTGLPFIDDDQNPTTPAVRCFDPTLQEIVLCELKSEDKNFVGQVFIRQRTAETITTEFRVSRSIQPNSDGAQVTQDVVRGYFSKSLTPRISTSMGATYIRQEAVGKETAGTLAQRFDRDYAQANANLTWSLSRTWWLDAGYFFTYDEQTSGFSTSTVNHAFSLYLRYTGLGSH